MPRNKDWNQILQEGHDNFTVLIDEPDANTTYIGKAPFGTATSSNKWQIQKISKSGDVTTKAWANSDDDFNQIWDDRAILNYL